MRALAECQATFGRALLDPHATEPGGLWAPPGAGASRRFAVYRNNALVGLVEGLRDAFPAVSRIVGEECFIALAVPFARQSPPKTPVMLDYGAGFPSYLEHHEIARDLAYLPGVARIERAWVEAYHSAEADRLAPADLLHLSAEALRTVRLLLHPSARMVRTAFRALTVWEMNAGRRALAHVEVDAGSETALILRPEVDVVVERLSEGEAEFLACLDAGLQLSECLARAAVAGAAFDAEAALGRLIEVGAFRRTVASSGVSRVRTPT